MSDITDTRDLEKELSDLLEACECEKCGGTGSHDNGDECISCGGTGHAETADDMPEDDPDRERALDIEQARDEISEWYHGETLIHEDSFEDYARQFAEDIGAIDESTRWPCDCIDWERAARELSMDYSSIEIGGETYYYRG